MRVLVLGGDGFCGWPTSLYLSERGYDVTRAAPYSMRSPVTKRYSADNNVRATHNLLAALVQTRVDAAIAHLGTMGVYGYGWSGTAPIPEGCLTVKVPTPAGCASPTCTRASSGAPRPTRPRSTSG
jgi:nucleoside-diphosphate-sugar epimerase